MSESMIRPPYKDRTPFLFAIGGLMLLIGIAMAFLGPVEMYCFYLFSDGGRFHYEGFGFGSFMFGNLACQIIGYYLIAVVLIPLGYGHLKRRRWARILTLALLWFWMIVGIPLSLVFAFILFSAKDLTIGAALVVMILLGLSYFVLPGLLIRFYRGRNVTLSFERRDSDASWVERLPVPILVMGILFLFYVVALQMLIFFNGVFPVLGMWVSGLQGIILVATSMLALVGLTWGTLQLRRWAWGGALCYFGWMTLSWTVTLLQSSWSELLLALNFPPLEMEILQRMPFQGFHFAILLGIPLLLTLGLIVGAKGYFEGGEARS